MTVCISGICNSQKAIVLASDGMITSSMPPIQFETITKKMTVLSDTCIALTAGDALAYAELFSMVKLEIDKEKEKGIDDIVAKIKEGYKFLRKRTIQERILNPRAFDDFNSFYEKQQTLLKEVALTIQREIDQFNYRLDILISGISNGKAHIYAIINPGTSICYDNLGFNAIGIGAIHAINVLVARECHSQKSLEEVFLIIYEAKKRAEIAPGVGSKVTDLSIITQEGIVQFPREQINRVDDIYKMWIEHKTEWKDELGKLIEKVSKEQVENN
jgi:hypothetical protein